MNWKEIEGDYIRIFAGSESLFALGKDLKIYWLSSDLNFKVAINEPLYELPRYIGFKEGVFYTVDQRDGISIITPDDVEYW